MRNQQERPSQQISPHGNNEDEERNNEIRTREDRLSSYKKVVGWYVYLL